MPTTNTHELTLIREGAKVKINVRYNAVFSVFERHLAGLGLKFRERIDVIGVDAPGAASSDILTSFPSPALTVTDGTAPQTIARNVLMTVSRLALDEDSNPLIGPDVLPDQIRCSVRIEAVDLPVAVTATKFTNQRELGSVSSPAAAANA